MSSLYNLLMRRTTSIIIDPNEKVTLIVISPKGKEVRFTFDLSKIL